MLRKKNWRKLSMISSKKYVDETLKSHQLKANKSLGQNFLVEEEIAQEIIKSAHITSATCVIEIGPGLGALTEFCVKEAGLVLAYEIDENMVNILNETFKEYSNIQITHSDFLKVDIFQLIESIKQKGYEHLVILSNLPYYITSKLLNRILIHDLPIQTIITMMQKEVGQKILKPDKKDYNVLSGILDYQYLVSIVKYVSKNAYLPRPEIDSIVLKFEKVSPLYDVDFHTLLQVSEALFSFRRKTIANNLKTLFKSQDDLNDCLNTLNLSSTLHVEQLNIKQIIQIAQYLSNHFA